MNAQSPATQSNTFGFSSIADQIGLLRTRCSSTRRPEHELRRHDDRNVSPPPPATRSPKPCVATNARHSVSSVDASHSWISTARSSRAAGWAHDSIGLATLVVRDYDEAIRWYVDRLGFVVHEDTRPSDEKRWWWSARRSRDEAAAAKATGSQAERIGDQTGGRGVLLAHRRLRGDARTDGARGVQFVELPRAERYGTVAVFVDLYGNRWDLVGS
jgi:catechol 2,3-dioxygenase-like lactoylglutathione lyase family enzyme